MSRLVDASYYADQCALIFPPGPNGETFGLNNGKTYSDVNVYTGGWSIGSAANASKRLQYTNGGFDPWREATVSSDFRPEGMLQSSAQTPVQFVPGGFHVSDAVTENGKVNAGAKVAIDKEVAQLVEWMKERPGGGGGGGYGRAWRA